MTLLEVTIALHPGELAPGFYALNSQGLRTELQRMSAICASLVNGVTPGASATTAMP